MKVVCIDKISVYDVTIGKTYEVLEIHKDGKFYNILDDDNYRGWLIKDCFKPLSEYRNEKIDKLLT